MATFDDELTDGVRVNARTLTGEEWYDELEVAVRIVDPADIMRGFLAAASDTFGIGSALLSTYGMVVVERLRIAQALGANHYANIYAADATQIGDNLLRAAPVSLADEVGVALSQEALTAISIIERLGLGSTLGVGGRFQLSLTQSLRLADRLAQFFGAEVEEGIAFDASIVARQLAIAGLVEGVDVATTVNPHFILSVKAADHVAIHAEDVVRMLFSPTLLDGVEIEAGYLAPDGSFTTWAMNARTGAVSEYQNYAFNSFAPVGNRYVGAAADGLYELLGDDDDGDSIIARIKGGYMQFGGTHLSRLNGAYIATRGEDDFILRIITGDDTTYNYAVRTKNMTSTKVRMGKGQRARYFAFELVSSGADFDLDTLEFVPIIMQRRV